MTSWVQGLTVLFTDLRAAWRHAHFGDDQGQEPRKSWRTPALPPRGPSRGAEALRKQHGHRATALTPAPSSTLSSQAGGRAPVRATLFPAGAAHRGAKSMRRPPLGFSPSVPQAPGVLPPNRSLTGMKTSRSGETEAWPQFRPQLGLETCTVSLETGTISGLRKTPQLSPTTTSYSLLTSFRFTSECSSE